MHLDPPRGRLRNDARGTEGGSGTAHVELRGEGRRDQNRIPKQECSSCLSSSHHLCSWSPRGTVITVSHFI